MSTYLLIDGQQQGPYSPAQLHALLSSSTIQRDCLAWRVGLPEWKPLHSIVAGWHERKSHSRPGSAGAALGIIALIIGVLGIGGWPALLVVGSFMESEAMLTLLGLLMFGGMGLNLLGAVLAVIGLLGAKVPKTVPIVALCLNGLQLVGVVLLVAVGMAMEAAAPPL